MSKVYRELADHLSKDAKSMLTVCADEPILTYVGDVTDFLEDTADELRNLGLVTIGGDGGSHMVIFPTTKGQKVAQYL